MKKYPSIEQFRHVIKNVRLSHDYHGDDNDGKPIYLHKTNYPVLKFQGTVKLHGTNSGIAKYSDGRIEYQSRSRVLSLDKDNASFMESMVNKDLSFLFEWLDFKDYAIVFGEWCGGNIQKGVAINGLDKMFVIFGIKVDDKWIDLPKDLHDNKNGIYNILQFKTYEIDIDFNNPESAQNKIIEMTIEVEDCCPVGKFFGVEGIGEGIVFTCKTNQDLKFKSKGEKHSSSKVKKLNSIDTESVSSALEFADYAVTTQRLHQGLSFLNENGISVIPENTGKFLSWIVSDVLKEEADTIQANALNDKFVKHAITTKARTWFLNHVSQGF